MNIIARAEAKALGLQYFYTGTACIHGHAAERYVSNRCCVECNKDAHKRVKAEHPLLNTWYMMIQRCANEEFTRYEDYGGRGITVCDRWIDPVDGYDKFVADMGTRPEGFTLDRIDYNGNYEPSNCRWADGVTQSRNTRQTKIKGEDVFRVRGLLSEGLTRRQVAAMYSCSHSIVTACRRAYA